MADNVIELNGKRYDAISGAFLGAARARALPPPAHTPAKGRVIDGFIRPMPASPKADKPKTENTPPNAAASAVAKKPAMPVHKALPAAAHKPQRAQTLMRRAVHKPKVTMKPAIKPQAPAEIVAKPVSAITHKRSALQVDPARLERAKNVARHGGVRRFLPLKPDHAAAAITPRVPREVPVIAVRPAPAQHHAPKHSDIFEAAIAHADSHKQPPHKTRRSHHQRLINTLALVGTFLVIGGFIAYLNIPNIQLHVASVQAGFRAGMPAYKPTGYSLQDGIKRMGNVITMTFHSGENSYTIVQQPSNWNSQTLVENTLALSGDNHTTLEVGGRTIYIYDGSNAVWVNGGIRYDLNTTASLTTDDISRLAASL